MQGSHSLGGCVQCFDFEKNNKRNHAAHYLCKAPISKCIQAGVHSTVFLHMTLESGPLACLLWKLISTAEMPMVSFPLSYTTADYNETYFAAVNKYQSQMYSVHLQWNTHLIEV